jgi:hypothetical protein
MKTHYDLSDQEFEEQFASCQLNAAIFSHEAHLRLAWIHVSKYGIDNAIENICSQLKAFTQFLGASDKYNETVTIAAIKAVYHFMLKSNTDSFQHFISENPRLKTNFKDLLSQHYSIDIFNSELAKSSFLEPELLPFD